MMSEEPHLLRHHHHHHHHFNEFSTIAGNSIPSTMPSTFDAAANHNLFTMNIPTQNQTWRAWPEPPPAAAQPATPWPIEPPLHPNQIQTQTLSLSLYNPPQPPSYPFHLKNSKYLLPSQELLSEFCSLAAGNTFNRNPRSDHNDRHSGHQSLYSMEPLELQKRKAKLLSMLEEVDRRYRRYCEQMKAVVSSFEEVAGDGAAVTYSVLASKAMSRHFRCLRDGISAQIKATRKAMGENDNASAVAPGQTRGETPRLKLLDQCLRQHKAFQQAGMMETHPWRPQRGLPERSVSILRAWLFEHFLHPYPSDVDKHILARQTGLSRGQVSNWFINARVRLWKPMVEDMYLEELKEEEKNSNSSNPTAMQELASDTNPNPNPNPSPSSQPHFHEQHSLSSIINNMNPHHNPNPNNLSFGFGSYSGHELTLGLQQHERPLLFSRDDEEDDEEYSIMASDGQNIPYRNLIGAQLLRHLAG